MNKKELTIEFTDALRKGILERWYPLVVDKECGGYFTNVTYRLETSPRTGKDDRDAGQACVDTF